MKSRQTFKLIRHLLCLMLLLLGAGVHAQQPPQPPVPVQDESEEVIRLDTELVQVRAVVTDGKGQPVDGLTRDDFEVFEDGRPQPISFFSVVRAPVGPSGQPGGRAEPANRAAPARTIVLFADTLHLAPANLARAKRAMRKFVDEMMTDRDSVAVIGTSGSLGALQQFTSDRRMLRIAIERLTPFQRPATSFTAELAARVLIEDEEAISAGLSVLIEEEGLLLTQTPADKRFATARAMDVLSEENRLRRVSLDTLAAVIDRLAKMKGQRLLAFVSNGFTHFDQGGTRDRLPLERVWGRAARSGIAIYSIYGIGLSSGGHPMNGVSSEAAENTLRDFAEETGGHAFINSNDLGEGLQKMLDANRVYYTLAYYPPRGGGPVKFRKLKVSLKKHPEYSVRTQKGYLPSERVEEQAAATPRERLFKEVIAPLPATDLDVTSAAHYLEREADDYQVTLQVHFGGERLAYAQEGENHLLRCEVFALIFDKEGKVAQTVAEIVSTRLSPAQLAEARRNGYRYWRRLKLKPGLYQVRVGVREIGSERLGTSTSWVEVPDLSRGRLELSSLFLGAAGKSGADADETAGAARGLKLLLDGASVKGGEALSYRLVVYNASAPGGAASASDALLKIEVLRGESEVFAGEWQPLSARAIRRDGKGIEVSGELKLGLPADSYTLRVSAKNPKSNKTVTQTVDFEVAP